MNPPSTTANRWRPITVFNLLVGLLFSLSALAQPAFLKDGLVAYYPFNGNANDESGNGKNGQLNGVQFANDRYGSGTSSAAFDGSKYIGLPEISPTLGQPKASFTVSLWVKPSQKIANLFISATTDNSYQFCRVGSGSDNRVIIYHRGSGQNNEPVGNILLKPDEWNSVIYKTDGINGLGSVFINGTRDAGLDFKYDSSVNYYQPNRTWAIGTTLNTTCGGCNPYYQGGIDDVRIYNRALSDGEVKALYDYESTPPDNSFVTNGLIAYYPFNGNANDESGNGNQGVTSNVEGANNRFGSPNSAWRFSPDKASVITVNKNNFPTGLNPITVSFWAQLENPKAVNAFTKYPVFGSTDGSNSWNFNIVFQPDGKTFTPNVERFDNNSFVGAYLKWSLYPNYNSAVNWHHIVVSFRGTNTSGIFLNGVYFAWETLPTTATAFRSGGTFQIGSLVQAPGGNTFSGLIDDFRIYNRALSNSEVKALYDYENTPPVQSPIIVQQPVSQTVNSGDNLVLSVGLQVAGSYNYQWQMNEQNISGATGPSLSINSADAGSYRYRVIVSNSAGTVISDSATLTVVTPPPPAIATQPIGKTVQEGSNVSLSVVAVGQGVIVYQWQFNEQNLPGATSATLNLNGVKLNTAGRYRVLVSSQYGVTISDTVTLTVNPNPPPTIVTQPLSRTPAEGTQVSLTVTATGLGTLTYQWQINNQNIPGATSSTLVLSAVRPSANGIYRVIIGNPYGTTISTEATVTVIVTDSDSDGLSDYEELLLGTNANKADSDADGLSDFAEIRTYKSNPLTTDTDGDGYSDGIEVARDGNPNNRSVTPTGALAVFPAVDVEFYTLNSVKYQLEVSSDMVAWTAQGGVVVGNGGSQNHLVRASKATQFWRLKVVQ
jgi:hypothetical protein